MPAQGRMKAEAGPISLTSPVAFLRNSSTLTSSLKAIFPIEGPEVNVFNGCESTSAYESTLSFLHSSAPQGTLQILFLLYKKEGSGADLLSSLSFEENQSGPVNTLGICMGTDVSSRRCREIAGLSQKGPSCVFESCLRLCQQRCEVDSEPNQSSGVLIAEFDFIRRSKAARHILRASASASSRALYLQDILSLG